MFYHGLNFWLRLFLVEAKEALDVLVARTDHRCLVNHVHGLVAAEVHAARLVILAFMLLLYLCYALGVLLLF